MEPTAGFSLVSAATGVADLDGVAAWGEGATPVGVVAAGAAAACRGLRRRCVEPAIATVAFNEPAPSMRRALRFLARAGSATMSRSRASVRRPSENPVRATCTYHPLAARAAACSCGRREVVMPPRRRSTTLSNRDVGRATAVSNPPRGKTNVIPLRLLNETFIFVRRAVSKKGNFSGKVYPVHIPIFVTRRAVGYWIRDLQRRCDARATRHRSSTAAIHPLSRGGETDLRRVPAVTHSATARRTARASVASSRARAKEQSARAPSLLLARIRPRGFVVCASLARDRWRAVGG